MAEGTDRELRTGIPAVDAALRTLRESLRGLARAGVWVEVSRDAVPQDQGGKRVFSRRGATVRDLALKGGADNYLPNPLPAAPAGRLVLWQSAAGTLIDLTPADPVAWVVVRPSVDMTVRMQVLP